MADGYPTTPARNQNAGAGFDSRRAAASARVFQRADREVGLLEQDASQPILAALQLQGFDAQQLVDHLRASGSSESPESGNVEVRIISANGAGRELGHTSDQKLVGAVRFAALTCTSLVPSDEDVLEIALRAGPQLLAVRHLTRQALIEAWAKGRAASESGASGSTSSRAYPVSISLSCADAAVAAHGEFVAAAARGDGGAIAFSSPTPQRAAESATAGSRPTTADLPEGGSGSGRQQRGAQASSAVLQADPPAADAVPLQLSVSIGFCSAGVLQLSVAAVEGLRPVNVLHRSRCAVLWRVAGKTVKSALSSEPLPTATFAADGSTGGLTLWLDARDYANDAQVAVVGEDGTELVSACSRRGSWRAVTGGRPCAFCARHRVPCRLLRTAAMILRELLAGRSTTLLLCLLLLLPALSRSLLATPFGSPMNCRCSPLLPPFSFLFCRRPPRCRCRSLQAPLPAPRP